MEEISDIKPDDTQKTDSNETSRIDFGESHEVENTDLDEIIRKLKEKTK